MPTSKILGGSFEPLELPHPTGLAEIARERTLPSISGKNKTRGNCDAKNISIHDRIQQYPGEEDFVDEKCK